jgi:hypothetical protein
MNNYTINHADDGVAPAELSFLRAVAIAPPPEFSDKLISEALATRHELQPAAKLIRPNFGWWKTAAAAAILLLIVGAVFYRYQQNKENNTVAASIPEQSPSPEASPNSDLPKAAIDSSTPGNVSSREAGVQNSSQQLANQRPTEAKGRWKNQGSMKQAENGALAFAGTDVLYKLVNYKYREAEQFMAALSASPQKRISIDRYSYINVSEKMNGLLQRMYETKKNGKPTGKARRTKKIMEKWKKADAEYFDRNLSKNPLDIIDLSEFILK